MSGVPPVCCVPREVPNADGLPDLHRLRALLARGVQMGLALDRWLAAVRWLGYPLGVTSPPEGPP